MYHYCMGAKKNISELRSLHPKLQEIYDSLINKLLNHHLIGSTLVEGSTFTESEAKKVLQGQSIHGHVIDEHRELTNGIETASFIHRIFFQSEKITTSHLDYAHQILFKGVGKPKEKLPGKNRSMTNTSAFTVLLSNDVPEKFEYENPLRIKEDYQPFIDFHINKPFDEDEDLVFERIAKLYFQFQMLHPYSDGNGRLGRFLVSGKIAAEKGWFFRFELSDGPDHLRVMMDLTFQYKENPNKLDYKDLVKFFQNNIERKI